MFCDHSQLCRRHKAAGQDVFLEYRRHAKTFHQARPDTLNFVRTKFSCHSDRGQDSQSDNFCIRCKTAAPAGLANASRPPSKLRTRSPLLRRVLRQKSPLNANIRAKPRAIHFRACLCKCVKLIRVNFAVSGRERAGFWRETRRNALRAPAAVRRTDVMVNNFGS